MKPSYGLLSFFTECAARAWFSDDPEAAEHLRIRSILMDQALSPVDPLKGITENPDGTKERPLFHYEYRCADYDDEKGKVLIDKALHEQDRRC